MEIQRLMKVSSRWCTRRSDPCGSVVLQSFQCCTDTTYHHHRRRRPTPRPSQTVVVGVDDGSAFYNDVRGNNSRVKQRAKTLGMTVASMTRFLSFRFSCRGPGTIPPTPERDNNCILEHHSRNMSNHPDPYVVDIAPCRFSRQKSPPPLGRY